MGSSPMPFSQVRILEEMLILTQKKHGLRTPEVSGPGKVHMQPLSKHLSLKIKVCVHKYTSVHITVTFQTHK